MTFEEFEQHRANEIRKLLEWEERRQAELTTMTERIDKFSALWAAKFGNGK